MFISVDGALYDLRAASDGAAQRRVGVLELSSISKIDWIADALAARAYGLGRELSMCDSRAPAHR